VDFEIIGPVQSIETLATGRAIRELRRLRRRYGKGRWRKRKGLATVRLRDDTTTKQRCTGTRPTELVGGR
jgi:hypothetical protein